MANFAIDILKRVFKVRKDAEIIFSFIESCIVSQSSEFLG